MFILKNALENIWRNKGRNILVGLVLLAVIGVSVVGLVINSTTSAIIDDYRARFGSRVTISFDVERFWEYIDPSIDQVTAADLQLTAEDYVAISQSRYVLSYTMTASMTSGSNDITAVDEMDMPDFGGGFMMTAPGGGMVGGGELEGDERITPKFRVHGNRFEEFETGERFLADGRMPQADGEAIISQELAELNDFVVGDTITVYRSTIMPVGGLYSLENPEAMTFEVRNFPTTLNIAGIYTDLTEAMGALAGLGIVIQNPIMNRRNEILTTTATLAQGIADGGVTIDATFYLRNPAYLSVFEAEVHEISGRPWITLSTDVETFYTIVEPVEGLRSVSITFIIVVLALGAVILILLTGIAIRERKYEIGVLRAMGMKKSKVARGLLYEMLALTAVCLVIGLGAGIIAAQPIADNLLAQQVAAVERVEQGGFQFGGMGGGRQQVVINAFDTTPDVEPLSEISVRLGVDVMIQIAGIALLLAFIASAMGIINIMRYEPIKILMERD